MVGKYPKLPDASSILVKYVYSSSQALTTSPSTGAQSQHHKKTQISKKQGDQYKSSVLSSMSKQNMRASFKSKYPPFRTLDHNLFFFLSSTIVILTHKIMTLTTSSLVMALLYTNSGSGNNSVHKT